jgi:uncharacterized Rmd1/YagE family protein
MNCNAYCTADTYLIKPLYEFLRTKYRANVTRDVIHIEVPHEERVGDFFFFPYGVAISWGLDKTVDRRLLDEIQEFENEPGSEFEIDEFTFVYGETAKVVDDEIILPNRETLTKLAISHGLAQSVELAAFETVIQNAFNKTSVIPRDLAKKGKISLSRNEIRRKMGELFIERSSINLHADVLDLPEFFWDYPELEPYYQMIANYLEIQTRVEVLNHRLDIMHELYEVLGNELNHQHSSRLEWIIILLIITEVVLTLMRDVFRIL